MSSQQECSSTRNIFVVLSDERVGEDLCRRLTATPGLRCVGVATSVDDGVEMLSPGSVHAIIVGDQLPDAGLWNAVRAFRDLDPGAGVVVMAESPRMDALREARVAGAAGFITTGTPFEDVVPLLWLGLRGRMFVDADVVLALADQDPSAPMTRAGDETDIDLRHTDEPRGGNGSFVGSDVSGMRAAGVRANGSADEPGRRAVPLTSRELEVLALLGRGLDPTSIAGELGLSIHTARGHVKRILAKLGAHSQLEAVVMAVQLGLLSGLGRA